MSYKLNTKITPANVKSLPELSSPARLAKIAKLKKKYPSANKNKRAGALTVVSRKLADFIAQKSQNLSPQKFAKFLKTKILPSLPNRAWSACKDAQGRKTGEYKIVRAAWHASFAKLAKYCADFDNITFANCPYELFAAKGNSKLSFYSWSTLPGFSCPGAGDCLQFCYSYKAWRYPAALCRQIFNTLLLRLKPEIVAAGFAAIPQGKTVRLYVDGDIAEQAQLGFWQTLCESRKDLAVYGYSKSWGLFLSHANQGGAFAANYVLNLSSGSKYGLDIAAQLSELKKTNGKPLVRGIFAAVKIDQTGIPKGAERYNLPLYHQRVRAAIKTEYGHPGFSCPGDCNKCGTNTHLCGNEKAQNVIIAIGIH